MMLLILTEADLATYDAMVGGDAPVRFTVALR
jgi:hypothetical protein